MLSKNPKHSETHANSVNNCFPIDLQICQKATLPAFFEVLFILTAFLRHFNPPTFSNLSTVEGQSPITQREPWAGALSGKKNMFSFRPTCLSRSDQSFFFSAANIPPVHTNQRNFFNYEHEETQVHSIRPRGHSLRLRGHPGLMQEWASVF